MLTKMTQWNLFFIFVNLSWCFITEPILNAFYNAPTIKIERKQKQAKKPTLQDLMHEFVKSLNGIQINFTEN